MDAFESVYVIKDAARFFGKAPPVKIEIGGEILDTPLSNYFWLLEDDKWAVAALRAEK
jgi:hypothetical protein